MQHVKNPIMATGTAIRTGFILVLISLLAITTTSAQDLISDGNICRIQRLTIDYDEPQDIVWYLNNEQIAGEHESTIIILRFTTHQEGSYHATYKNAQDEEITTGSHDVYYEHWYTYIGEFVACPEDLGVPGGFTGITLKEGLNSIRTRAVSNFCDSIIEFEIIIDDTEECGTNSPEQALIADGHFCDRLQLSLFYSEPQDIVWYWNDEPIAGENESSITISRSATFQEGSYHATFKNVQGEQFTTGTYYADYTPWHTDLGKIVVCPEQSVTVEGFGDDYSFSEGLNSITLQATSNLCDSVLTVELIFGDPDECMTETFSFSDEVGQATNPKYLVLYPNPIQSNQQLTLKSKLSSELNVVLVNKLGKTIKQAIFETGSGQLDLTGLGTGIYFCRIESNGDMVTKKLFIK